MKAHREPISLNWIHQEGRDPHWSPGLLYKNVASGEEINSFFVSGLQEPLTVGTCRGDFTINRQLTQPSKLVTNQTYEESRDHYKSAYTSVLLQLSWILIVLCFLQKSTYGFTTMALVKWPYNHGLGACCSGTWVTTIFLGLYQRRSATA